jgi:uncharacterized OB-fold protein
MSETNGASLRPAEFEGFLANARKRRLAFPRCKACGRFHWYPMPRCPHCRSAEIAWQPIAGRGEVFSYTIVRHAFDKSRRDRLPYTVALITFADAPGVRFITNIVEADAVKLAIGDAVEPVFPVGEAEAPVVLFRPVRGAQS